MVSDDLDWLDRDIARASGRPKKRAAPKRKKRTRGSSSLADAYKGRPKKRAAPKRNKSDGLGWLDRDIARTSGGSKMPDHTSNLSSLDSDLRELDAIFGRSPQKKKMAPKSAQAHVPKPRRGHIPVANRAPPFSKKIREHMKKITGQRCEFCGEWTSKFEVHHVVPRAEGGKSTIENAYGFCRSCHQKEQRGTISRESVVGSMIRRPFGFLRRFKL